MDGVCVPQVHFLAGEDVCYNSNTGVPKEPFNTARNPIYVLYVSAHVCCSDVGCAPCGGLETNFHMRHWRAAVYVRVCVHQARFYDYSDAPIEHTATQILRIRAGAKKAARLQQGSHEQEQQKEEQGQEDGRKNSMREEWLKQSMQELEKEFEL